MTHSVEFDAPECERCEGTGDRYGRGPGNCTPNTLATTCPDCWGTGYVTSSASMRRLPQG